MPTCRALDKGSEGNKWRRIALGEILRPETTRDSGQQLLDQFSSFATTIQTRLDSNGAVNGSLGGSVEVEVERALAQVLRTPPTGGPAVGAAVLPAETATALAGPVLPPRQEVLRQEARLIVDAVAPIVGRSQPVVPNQRATSDVELYRAIVQYELQTLVDEIGRADGPRAPRVRVLLGGLVGWNPSGRRTTPPRDDPGDVRIFTRLLLGGLSVPTRALEEMLAAVGLLETGSAALIGAWNQYAATEDNDRLWAPDEVSRADPGPAEPSFAERMIRAAELGPVIAQDVTLVASALDAISFGFAERQTVELELHTLVDADLLGGEPLTRSTTVGDILDWADSLAGRIPQTLESTGQLGLNLVADQADELFWLIEAIYGSTGLTAVSSGSVGRQPSVVPLELLDAQVRRGFLSLARDLDELADLAFPIDATVALPIEEASRR